MDKGGEAPADNADEHQMKCDYCDGSQPQADCPHEPKGVSKHIVEDMKEATRASLWALDKHDVTLSKNVERWIIGIGARESLIPAPNGLNNSNLLDR